MKKVIFITGVSSGFGYATASLLANTGHIVYGTSRSGVQIDGVKIIPADVTQYQSVKQVVDEIIKAEGKIDVLINNAGMGIAGPIEDFSHTEIEKQMNTNFFGTVNCIKAVLPYMRKQLSGTIINISSIGGLMGLPFQGFYSASKFAIEGLSEALRLEVKPYKIHVVVIEPGDFHTSFTKNRRLVESIQNSDYNSQFQKTIAVIEKDETNGLNPEILAKKIATIINKKNPNYNYIVASFEQKLAVALKTFLPRKLFWKIIAAHYKT